MNFDWTILLRPILAVAIVGCGQSQDDASRSCVRDMASKNVSLTGGEFTFGETRFYPEEGPTQSISVAGFNVGVTEVTNQQFAVFVEVTDYKTRAERGLYEDEYATLPDDLRVPGSVVFVAPLSGQGASVAMWWKFVPGADWQHPEGPGSSIDGKEAFPVVHIAYEDAEAYAEWAGRRLPTEEEWEYAARGGLIGAPFEWGDEKSSKGVQKANTWQGIFPYTNSKKDGYAGAAPVGCYEPNGYGLYDMTGNVWEWTSTAYTPDRQRDYPAEGYDPTQPGVPVKVLKGGSFLCAENYCYRFRPAARHAQDLTLGTSHIGFRTVASVQE